MLNAATQAALLLTPELVEADRHLDIIAGAGGAILGLLALYELTTDEEVLQRALLCARHLLSERVEIEKGEPGSGMVIVTGFSHGAAGIAYALLVSSPSRSSRSFGGSP
jgi:lantibiotic modifying enzyme